MPRKDRPIRTGVDSLPSFSPRMTRYTHTPASAQELKRIAGEPEHNLPTWTPPPVLQAFGQSRAILPSPKTSSANRAAGAAKPEEPAPHLPAARDDAQGTAMPSAPGSGRLAWMNVSAALSIPPSKASGTLSPA